MRSEVSARDKLSRYVERHPTFSRREAFLATKNGVMRTVVDFDNALAALVSEGVIALAPDQPARGAVYVAVLPSGEVQESYSFSSRALEPPKEAALTRPRASILLSPRPDDVLSVAAARRHRDDRSNFLLEQIEARHFGKRVGDTLQAGELTIHDKPDLEALRRHLEVAR